MNFIHLQFLTIYFAASSIIIIDLCRKNWSKMVSSIWLILLHLSGHSLFVLYLILSLNGIIPFTGHSLYLLASVFSFLFFIFDIYLQVYLKNRVLSLKNFKNNLILLFLVIITFISFSLLYDETNSLQNQSGLIDTSDQSHLFF